MADTAQKRWESNGAAPFWTTPSLPVVCCSAFILTAPEMPAGGCRLSFDNISLIQMDICCTMYFWDEFWDKEK